MFQPLQFYGHTDHYTRKSREWTYRWYKNDEVNAEHPVYLISRQSSSTAPINLLRFLK